MPPSGPHPAGGRARAAGVQPVQKKPGDALGQVLGPRARKAVQDLLHHARVRHAPQRDVLVRGLRPRRELAEDPRQDRQQPGTRLLEALRPRPAPRGTRRAGSRPGRSGSARSSGTTRDSSPAASAPAASPPSGSTRSGRPASSGRRSGSPGTGPPCPRSAGTTSPWPPGPGVAMSSIRTSWYGRSAKSWIAASMIRLDLAGSAVRTRHLSLDSRTRHSRAIPPTAGRLARPATDSTRNRLPALARNPVHSIMTDQSVFKND